MCMRVCDCSHVGSGVITARKKLRGASSATAAVAAATAVEKVEKVKAESYPLSCLQPHTTLQLLEAVCNSMESAALRPPVPTQQQQQAPHQASQAGSQPVVVPKFVDVDAIVRSAQFRAFLLDCCSELLGEAQDMLDGQHAHEHLGVAGSGDAAGSAGPPPASWTERVAVRPGLSLHVGDPREVLVPFAVRVLGLLLRLAKACWCVLTVIAVPILSVTPSRVHVRAGRRMHTTKGRVPPAPRRQAAQPQPSPRRPWLPLPSCQLLRSCWP